MIVITYAPITVIWGDKATRQAIFKFQTQHRSTSGAGKRLVMDLFQISSFSKTSSGRTIIRWTSIFWNG